MPERWRPQLRIVLDRIAAGDYEALIADGIATGSADDFGRWVEEYPYTPVPLPPEAWDYSSYDGREGHPNSWWVYVDLWTAEEGRSDLTAEMVVTEDGDELVIEVWLVHVM